MSVKRVMVTRDVSAEDEHNYSGRDVDEGEILYTVVKPTYGCVNTQLGIALSDEPNEYPFFEFPLDAIKFLE